MPLKSKAQERFLWAKKPKMAQEFEDATPENAKLPEHVKKMALGGNPGLTDDQNEELYKYIRPKLTMDDVKKSSTAFDDSVAPFNNVPRRTAMPIPEKKSDNEKVQDSNPGHSVQDLKNAKTSNLDKYIDSQTAQIDKYGPDQERAVLDNIIQSRNSFGRSIPQAGATLADAIMQGVAGKGNPGFANQVIGQQNATDTLRAQEIPQLRAANEATMGAKEKLQGMTSSSPLGASMASSMGPILKSLGVSPTDAQKVLQNPSMAKSLLEPWVQLATGQQKAQLEMIQKQLEMMQRGQQISGEQKNQQAQRDIEERKFKTEHPVRDFLGLLPEPAATPTPQNNFDHPSIPPGTVYKAPDGTMRRKK